MQYQNSDDDFFLLSLSEAASARVELGLHFLQELRLFPEQKNIDSIAWSVWRYAVNVLSIKLLVYCNLYRYF